MSERKQKIVLEGFTLTIGKLIIEQDAEDSDSNKLPDNVGNAIVQLISASSRLVNAEATPSLPSSLSVSELPSKPQRKNSTSAIDESTGDANVDRVSRGEPNFAAICIEEMHEEGYLDKERCVLEILEELHDSGHELGSTELTPMLFSMTKQLDLSRRKDRKRGWMFRAN